MAIADLLMQPMPLGFRFRPSDFELVEHYLKGKISGRLKAHDDVMAVIDVCKCEPWDLPDKSLIKLNDPEWFFFAPKDRKYPTGQRCNRATEAGYWKATGKDRLIKSRLPGRGSVLVGTKKTLVFHMGRAPKGTRTCWIIHEYRTTEPEFESGKEGGFVLCRLFKKLEENIDGCTEKNADEMESSDLSAPTSRMYLPDETHNGTEAVVTFVTPLNQRFPKQEASQSLPLTVNIHPSQVNSSSEVDLDCVTSFPSKPIEGSCSDTGDHETDVAGAEVQSLLGDIICYLDQDYGKSPPGDFHEVHSFGDPYMDYSLFEGLPLDLPQNSTTEEVSVTDFLDSLISDPEECLPEGSNANGDSVTSCNEDVTVGYSWESVSKREPNVGSDGSTEATGAQDIVDLADEGFPTFSCNFSQANNYVCHIKESCSQFAVLPKEHLSRRVSFGPNRDSLHQELDNTSKMVGPGKATDISNNIRTETIQDNCSLAGIQVRSRQDLTNTENVVAQQGLAMRRVRLRKVHPPVSGNDQEFETMDINVHKKTVSEVVKHDKDLIKQEKSVPEYISSNSDAETCTTRMKDVLPEAYPKLMSRWNPITRVVGLLLAILFVVAVASWYLIF